MMSVLRDRFSEILFGFLSLLLQDGSYNFQAFCSHKKISKGKKEGAFPTPHFWPSLPFVYLSKRETSLRTSSLISH